MHVKIHVMTITGFSLDDNFIILNDRFGRKCKQQKTNENSLLSCSYDNGALTADKTKTNWKLQGSML